MKQRRRQLGSVRTRRIELGADRFPWGEVIALPPLAFFGLVGLMWLLDVDGKLQLTESERWTDLESWAVFLFPPVLGAALTGAVKFLSVWEYVPRRLRVRQAAEVVHARTALEAELRATRAKVSYDELEFRVRRAWMREPLAGELRLWVIETVDEEVVVLAGELPLIHDPDAAEIPGAWKVDRLVRSGRAVRVSGEGPNVELMPLAVVFDGLEDRECRIQDGDQLPPDVAHATVGLGAGYR